MNKDYRAINEQCLNHLLDMMTQSSEEIIRDLIERGYKVVDVTCGANYVEYNGKEYHYLTKPITYSVSPIGLSYLLNNDEILSTIEKCVPDKDEYFIAMYMPIHLYTLSPQVRFVSFFDVIKIEE